jgi:hypothetical protein
MPSGHKVAINISSQFAGRLHFAGMIIDVLRDEVDCTENEEHSGNEVTVGRRRENGVRSKSILEYVGMKDT